MGGEGSYSVDIVGTDGEDLAYTSASLVLECDPCAGAAYSYFTLDSDCPPVETLCCEFPEEGSPATVNWTATYYDTCDNVMGSDSGSFQMWQVACEIFTSGDTTFTTPDMVEHEVFCDCLNP